MVGGWGYKTGTFVLIKDNVISSLYVAFQTGHK